MNKALYLGPLYNIRPTKDFPNIKEFIYVDTHPRSEFDNNSFHQGFYKTQFYDNLIHKCHCFGFVLVKTIELDPNYYKKIFSLKQRLYYTFWDIIPQYIGPTLLLFENKMTQQVLKYYISTNILYNMCPELKEDIEESDALIVSGYQPNIKLLDYFTSPKTFIRYTGIRDAEIRDAFEENKEENKEEDKTIMSMHKNFTKYFNRYLLISDKKMDYAKEYTDANKECTKECAKECSDIYELKRNLSSFSS